MLSKEIALPATWEICQQNKWIQINSSRRCIEILIHGFLSSVLFKWSLSSTEAAVINTSSPSCILDYWEYSFCDFLSREEKKKRQKRKKTPILFSDSGFEPLACPAVSGIAFNISLIQQWLICIMVLLSKGKVFEKNTELCVINKRLAVEMHHRKQDQNHYKVRTEATGKVPPIQTGHLFKSNLNQKSKWVLCSFGEMRWKVSLLDLQLIDRPITKTVAVNFSKEQCRVVGLANSFKIFVKKYYAYFLNNHPYQKNIFAT